MNQTLSLQITMLLLILAGLAVKKLGIVGEQGQKNITDLVLYLVLPCNIVRSFMIEYTAETFTQLLEVLAVSVGIQFGAAVLGRLLYSRRPNSQRMSLQYGLICSNAGFLGNPIAEGLFGSMGLAMASVFLIPVRVMMWSSGIAIYTHTTDWRATLKKVVTHPCIIACALGVVLLLTQWQLPGPLATTLQTISNCNTALSMMVIGMILAGADPRSLLDKQALLYSLIRLVGMPLAVYAVCMALGLPALVTGVCTILTAMPAGATTSILASKYKTCEADELFGTDLVVGSTILSMLTIPLWGMLLTAAL